MNILILLLAGFPFAALPVFIVVGGWFLYLLITKLLGIHPTPSPEMIKAGACLERQAVKRHGVVKNNDFGRQPELTFPYDDTIFTVSLHTGTKWISPGAYATFQTNSFPDENFRIASKKFKATISFTRVKDFNGDLCGKYEFEGSGSAFIHRVLTAGIQIDLMEYEPSLEVRFGNHRSAVHALKPTPGRFYLSSDDFKAEDEDYDRLIETTVKFYERLKVMAAEEKANKKDSYEKLLSI